MQLYVFRGALLLSCFHFVVCFPSVSPHLLELLGMEQAGPSGRPSKPDVIPKFDMHIHTSKLSQSDLDDLIAKYEIPAELHPMLPDPGMTMDKLPRNKIGIYTRQLDIGGIRIPFSKFLLAVIRYFKVHISQLVPIGLNRVTLFEVRCYSLQCLPTVSLFRAFYRLCKVGHWFSFESRTGRKARKCFIEVLTGLKFWKEKFFLIDRRAIPDAMAWRHKDSEITDGFPLTYPEDSFDKLSAKPVKLREVPQCLLWMTGLSSVWEPKELEVVLRDAEGHGNLLLYFFFVILFYIMHSHRLFVCSLFCSFEYG